LASLGLLQRSAVTGTFTSRGRKSKSFAFSSAANPAFVAFSNGA